MPDCLDYEFTTADGNGDNVCVPGTARLMVTGPEFRADEVLTRIEPHQTQRSQLRVSVKEMIGSALDRFKADAGTELGVISLSNGVPTEFQLGPGLFPNEVKQHIAKPVSLDD